MLRHEAGSRQKGPSILATPIQRALFAIGCTGLLPWACMRFLAEIARSDGVRDYGQNVFITPVLAWLQNGWLFHLVPWYDLLFLPSSMVILLAAAWKKTGYLVIKWVTHG